MSLLSLIPCLRSRRDLAIWICWTFGRTDIRRAVTKAGTHPLGGANNEISACSVPCSQYILPVIQKLWSDDKHSMGVRQQYLKLTDDKDTRILGVRVLVIECVPT